MPEYFLTKAPALRSNGFMPIPIVPGTKRPAISDWPRYDFPAAHAQAFKSSSVGVLCGYRGLVVVDGDIYDPVVAVKMHTATLSHLGFTLERIGAAPKFAFMYRMDPALCIGKVRSRAFIKPGDAKPSRIEILGKGAYLVTHGIHPDTRREYEWPQHDLASVHLEQLPLITTDMLGPLISLFETTCLMHGMRAVDDHQQIAERHRPTHSSKLGQHAADEGEALGIIAALPNNLPYDEWIRVGHAIKGALGDTAEGLEAWLDFSSKYEGNDLDACIVKWDGFRPKKIGMGTLKMLYRDYERKRALAMFKEVPDASPEVVASALEPAQSQSFAGAPLYAMPVGELAKVVRTPGWLVRSVLRRASIYTMTAHPGAGKTTLSALLAASVQSGTPFAGMETRRGNVLYLAADDSRGALFRIIGMERDGVYAGAHRMHISPMPIDLTSSEAQQWLQEFAASVGGLALIVIDTSLCYVGEGFDSENDNMGMSRYLASLRLYTRLHGEPTILVLCHPRKGAANSADDLVPRGGSAALAATDGNLAVWLDNGVITMHHSAKMRSGGFEELYFGLDKVTLDRTAEDGTPVETVIARHLLEEDMAQILGEDASNESRIYGWLQARPDEWFAAAAIELALQLPLRTVQRHLNILVELKKVKREGQARSTRYSAARVTRRGH